MKRLFTMILLGLSLALDAQTVRTHITDYERDMDMLKATPRQRVARMTSLTLDTTWRTVVFVEGSSTFNTNTFPSARWDYVNNKLLINTNITFEQAYDLSFDYNLTNVTGQSKVQLRFLIPSPTPIMAPFPDDGATAYVDLSELNMPGTYKRHWQYPIYGNASMRQYGLQIQMRVQSYTPSVNLLSGVISLLTTILTGTNRVTLNNCNLNIYAK